MCSSRSGWCNGPGRGGPHTAAPWPVACERRVGLSFHELVRRGIAEARMRTHLVVVLPPSFDDHLRLGARTKPFEAQALVAEFAVEAFHDAILPRLARLDQCRTNALRH